MAGSTKDYYLMISLVTVLVVSYHASARQLSTAKDPYNLKGSKDYTSYVSSGYEYRSEHDDGNYQQHGNGYGSGYPYTSGGAGGIYGGYPGGRYGNPIGGRYPSYGRPLVGYPSSRYPSYGRPLVGYPGFRPVVGYGGYIPPRLN